MDDMLEGMALVHSEATSALDKVANSIRTVLDMEEETNPDSAQIEKLNFAWSVLRVFEETFQANYEQAVKSVKQGGQDV